jgi:hypothetical protein
MVKITKATVVISQENVFVGEQDVQFNSEMWKSVTSSPQYSQQIGEVSLQDDSGYEFNGYYLELSN